MARHSIRFACLIVLSLLISRGTASAGPPLLCHPFDIGSARSLPWDGAKGWAHGRGDYDVKNLVRDTEALLTPSMPVIVRMETLRRAALYAGRDAEVAKQLLYALNARARNSVGAANANPLALFDAGYLAETFRQITLLEPETEFRAAARALKGAFDGTDGYAMVKKSATMRPDDPALEFAAALIALGVERTSYPRHAAKAREGTSKDVLLAKNIKQLAL
jgi:hypothetical protein